MLAHDETTRSEFAMTTVLITGVRGNTGRQVADQLVRRGGVTVRGGSSNPDAVDQAGVTPVRFDWDDPATWGPAAEGADRVYLQRVERKDSPELIAAFLDAVPALEKVVILGDNVHGAGDHPADSWEGRVEAAVTSRRSKRTLLRPAWFQQSLAEPRYLVSAIKDDGRLEIPTAGAKIAWVDTRDIAEIAVKALLEDGHEGKAYDITGPEPVTVAYIAERISAAAGHEVVHVDSPLQEAVDAFAKVEGVDPWYVDYIHTVWGLVSNGSAGRTTDTVERLTGHPPRRVEDLIQENAAVWRR
jgi:uncharacterized protein YbjT (DUF2867 family)